MTTSNKTYECGGLSLKQGDLYRIYRYGISAGSCGFYMPSIQKIRSKTQLILELVETISGFDNALMFISSYAEMNPSVIFNMKSFDLASKSIVGSPMFLNAKSGNLGTFVPAFWNRLAKRFQLIETD